MKKPFSMLGQTKNKEIIEGCINDDAPVLLIGDTGTGKTSIIRELAYKHKKCLIRINLNGQTSIDEFVGKWLIKGGETIWQDGVLIQAMRNGHWIVVDEINSALPEILFVLQSLLDDDKSIMLAEKDGEIVKPTKGFRFFATMNPPDEYAGTKDLNKAFLSRFEIILDFKYLKKPQEVKLLIERTKIDKKIAPILVEFANTVRKAKKNEELDYTFSTRDLIFWSKYYKLLGLLESFKVTVLNRANVSDRDILLRMFKDFFTKLEQFQKMLAENNIDENADEQTIMEKMMQQMQNIQSQEEQLERQRQANLQQENRAYDEAQRMAQQLKQQKQEVEEMLKKGEAKSKNPKA
jgi:Mg-chelatase subunit ChlI